MQKVSANFSESDVKDLFRRADIDGSDTIEFAEFLQMQLKRRAMIGAAALARLAVWAGQEVTPRSPEKLRPGMTSGASASTSTQPPPQAKPAAAQPQKPVAAPTATAAKPKPVAQPLGTAAASSSSAAPAPAPAPAPSLLRKGLTMPSFWGSSKKEEEKKVEPPPPSDRALDESYRELLKNKMASTNKAPVPEIGAEELDTLESLFHGADTNADGVVDWPEFKKVMEL